MFVAIGSDNFNKLPAIDQARIFLLQKSPTVASHGQQLVGLNSGIQKNNLKNTLQRLDMDDPSELNKAVVEIEEEKKRLELLEKENNEKQLEIQLEQSQDEATTAKQKDDKQSVGRESV